MSDLIDRGALVGKTEILYQHTESGKIIPWSAVRVCAINNVPTVDAEPVRHGRWIDKKRWSMGKWHKWLECSECKYQDYGLETYEDIPFTGPANYCPNCGARMDGGKKDAAD